MKLSSIKYLSFLFLLSCVRCSSIRPENNKISSAYFPKVSDERMEVWNMLLGSGYGKKPLDDGGIYEWIMRRYPQGDYRLEGRITYPCHTEYNIEYGDWGFDENISFTIQKGWIRHGIKHPKEGDFPYDWRVYEILEITYDTFQYRHLGTGNTFRLTRVSDDFKMQPHTTEEVEATLKKEQ